MKTRVLLSIAIIAMMILESSVSAAVVIKINTTKTYSVNPKPGSTIGATGYTWAVTGGALAFSNSTNSTQSVTWNALGPWTLSVFGTDATHSCPGDTVALAIQVVNVLPVTIAWGASPTLCPTNNHGGGDAVSSSLTVTGTVPVGNWTFNYTVDAGVVQTTSPNLSGANPTVNLLDKFANASNSATATHTIHIVSYTINGSTYDTSATPIDLSVTVNPSPTITAIF